MLDNIPYENIQNLENSLKGLTRLNASGIIQAEEQIKDFEDFLALYKKRQTRKNLPYYLYSIYENCDNVIEKLKKVYGDEIEKTLDYCAKATIYNDEIIQKIRFIILAKKFYPTSLGLYCLDGIESYLDSLKKRNETDNNTSVQFQINVMEEFLHLAHCAFKGSFDNKRRVDYTDPNNILHEGDFTAKLINGKASIIDCFRNTDNIIIPDTVEGIPVDSIGDYAFCGKNIKQVEIHSGIKNIGENAFLSLSEKLCK